MTALRLMLTAVCLLGMASSLQAQIIPFAKGQDYSDLRVSLLKSKWVPVKCAGPSHVCDDKMPELTCGNRVCGADWRKGKLRISFNIPMNTFEATHVSVEVIRR